MTKPFASIIGTPQDPLRHQPERDKHDSSVGKLAEGMQPDKLTAGSVSLKETPFGSSEQPPDAEADDLLKPVETEKATSLTAQPPQQRKPLQGGDYSPDEVLELLNSHYMIGKSEQEVAIFRIKDDGSLAFTPPEQFKLDVANIFVKSLGQSKKSAEKFWKESAKRHQRKIVFKPGGTTQSDEFNLWRGFGVEPRKGWQKQRRLLRHIREVICRRDKAKFKYLIRSLSWAVKNPDKHPGVAIMLKSRKQGTGKSTLGVVMLRIFGRHGMLIDNKKRLLGDFNNHLEMICFVVGEEVLWAGDHQTTDKLKSMITADTVQIERKYGGIHQIPNRLHLMLNSNHDHALAAGVGDRRSVVFEASDAHACDESWFDPLYRDLDSGGVSEFLYFLQNLELGDWHPRQILKTAETTEQQRMSADSVSQWSQACIDADAIIGSETYGSEPEFDLGATYSNPLLRRAYTGFCRQNRLHPETLEGFGSACTAMFGPRKRLSAAQPVAAVADYVPTKADIELNQKINELCGPRAEPRPAPRKKPRPWGYHVPEGEKWQEMVDERLGIKK